MLSSSPSSSSASRSKNPPPPKAAPPATKWRTASQERSYRRRLIDALRTTSAAASSSSAAPAPPPPRAIKDAADSALALTARGQSRWSRAILFGRPRRKQVLLKAGGKIRRRRRPRPAPTPPIHLPGAEMKGEKVRDRMRKLGRLVPGCRKLSAPSLLEEAADYVAALQMQVKTMRALTAALSVVSISAAAEGSEEEVAAPSLAEPEGGEGR